jgi:glycosyltransferase involved in cell wall biosynthesis
MKILVVGYACDPYRGSEPGVGWTAVCRIARRHDVCVLTDIHNKPGWEMAALEGIIPENVQVRFLRDRSACSKNRFIAHLQSWLNYSSFNRQVLQAAQKWHREVDFDICHQVTIATWRMPSPLCQLPVAFVWGPIGGAGFIPPVFRRMLSPSARLFERLRDLSSLLTKHSDSFRRCVERAAVVLVANEETEELIRPHRGNRPLMRLPIASLPLEKVKRFSRPQRSPSANPLQCFAGGNMIGSKGLSLALKALAMAGVEGLDFHYTIAGGGPDISHAKRLMESLGLSTRVTFHDGFKGQDYIDALHASDVYLLPSFREGTPVTLLEAMLAGCYAVVADMSAQGEIVRMAGGHAVTAETIPKTERGLADALLWCGRHREQLPLLAAASAACVAEYFSSERYDVTLERAYKIALS